MAVNQRISREPRVGGGETGSAVIPDANARGRFGRGAVRLWVAERFGGAGLLSRLGHHDLREYHPEPLRLHTSVTGLASPPEGGTSSDGDRQSYYAITRDNVAGAACTVVV